MTKEEKTAKLQEIEEQVEDFYTEDEAVALVNEVFGDEKSSQEIQEKIQNMTFDYANNMNIYVSINGNDNKGFNNLNSQMKLTQWSKNGHYYLYIPEQISWSKAYNKAMDF